MKKLFLLITLFSISNISLGSEQRPLIEHDDSNYCTIYTIDITKKPSPEIYKNEFKSFEELRSYNKFIAHPLPEIRIKKHNKNYMVYGVDGETDPLVFKIECPISITEERSFDSLKEALIHAQNLLTNFLTQLTFSEN